MNIYEKMSAITQEITAVAKNLNVGWGKSSYKAVGEADVLKAVKSVESKFGVYSYPYSRQIVETGVLTSTRNDGTETRQQFLRIETVYRFVNVEAPEEYIDITTYGDGVDPQDKAPGKAMTYGDKYALLKAYKIITGDDPDQYASEPMKAKETHSGRTRAAATPAAPVMTEQEAKDLKTKVVTICMKHSGSNLMGQMVEYFGVETLNELAPAQLRKAAIMAEQYDKKKSAQAATVTEGGGTE